MFSKTLQEVLGKLDNGLIAGCLDNECVFKGPALPAALASHLTMQNSYGSDQQRQDHWLKTTVRWRRTTNGAYKNTGGVHESIQMGLQGKVLKLESGAL
nr:hypothetical protein Itr_chr06CG07790 [Ipomoea trifida]